MTLTFTATQETFDTTGEREDLSDLIYMISPTETPFMQMVGRGTAYGTKHEWQMDELSAAGDNAVVEGEKVAIVLDVVPTKRLANHTQISSKYLSVTGTIEVTNKAGRNSELSYQLAKRAKELKRDMEFTMVGQTTIADMASNPGAGNAATARRSASVQAQFHEDWFQGGTQLIGVNINHGAGGSNGGWDDVSVFDAPVDGTQRPLVESMLKGVIQGAWTNGGDPTVIMTGPFNKTVISGFTGNSTRFDRGEDKRLVSAIDVYVSDFGEHRCIPNRFQLERDVFVLTVELFKIAYLRPFRQHALAKIGDSEDRTLLAEWTLELNNNAGSGWVADLSES